MAPGAAVPAARDQLAVAADVDLQTVRHALGWLVAGNVVGLLLAGLLLEPGLNRALAPLTYGRWVPVHLNIQLYGWCALPLVGLLFRLYAAAGDPLAPRLRRLALAAWSVALATGVGCWLNGIGSGKIFLDWHGPDRLIFCLALALLWGTLLLMYQRRLAAKPGMMSLETIGRWVLLGVLALVPVAMFIATSRAVYPPINPLSGGPTGVSLLGSSLGLVAIFIFVPWILGRPAADGQKSLRRLCWLYAAHLALFGVLGHHDAPNRSPGQLVAIASVAVWIPLLIAHYRRYAWPAGWRPWLLAFAWWSVWLVASAVFTFLPGVLDHLKFTNALVAHSHAAMAGVLGAFSMLVLLALVEGTPAASALSSKVAFGLWQTGLVAYVASMTAMGVIEGADPGILFRVGDLPTLFYLARAAAGGLMLIASLIWLKGVMGKPESSVNEAVS